MVCSWSYRPSVSIAGNILASGTGARRRPGAEKPNAASWGGKQAGPLRGNLGGPARGDLGLEVPGPGSSRPALGAVEQVRDRLTVHGAVGRANLEKVVLDFDLHVTRAEKLYHGWSHESLSLRAELGADRLDQVVERRRDTIGVHPVHGEFHGHLPSSGALHHAPPGGGGMRGEPPRLSCSSSDSNHALQQQ